MSKPIVPKKVLDDLSIFISIYYHERPPHPLLIAQKFLLSHQNYGNTVSLSTITDAVEHMVKKDPL